MKKLLFLLAVCFSAAVVNAQITTGESSSKVVRTGNRAQAGDFGIYIGATTDMFKNLADDGPSTFSAIPLINLKYMTSDKFELRLGIEWWRKKDKQEVNAEEYDFTQKTSQSTFTLSPGVAYHFSNKNLLDVYVGGELPFGWGTNAVDYDNEDYRANNFRIGLGAFIGLQAYIGNLPLAVGVEYGISTLYSTISNGTLTQDGMTINYNDDLSSLKNQKQSKWELGNQVRFTLSYYFDL